MHLAAYGLIPAIALLVFIGFVDDRDIHAQLPEVIEIDIGAGNTWRSHGGERQQNSFSDCTYQYPSFDLKYQDQGFETIGGLVRISTNNLHTTKCMSLSYVYSGTHTLPEQAQIEEMTITVQVDQATSPRTCQVLMTLTDYVPTNSRRPGDWMSGNNHGSAIMQDVHRTILRDMLIAERHVTIDNNFCLSTGSKVITVPTDVYPLILEGLRGQASNATSPGSAEAARHGLIVTFAQSDASTTPISSNSLRLTNIHIEVREVPTVTDTRGGTLDADYITLLSENGGAHTAAGSCTDARHDYSGTISTPQTMANWGRGVAGESYCSAAVMITSNNYGRAVDFAAIGFVYSNNVQALGADDGCDVLVTPVITETSQYGLWYDWIMSDDVPAANIMVEDTDDCRMSNTSDTLDGQAREKFSQAVFNIRDGNFGTFPDTAQTGTATDKFAVVIRPHDRSWSNGYEGTWIEFLGGYFLSTRHDDTVPNAVGSLSSTSRSPERLTLTWTEPDPAPLRYTNYEIRRFNNDGSNELIGTTSLGTRSFVVTELTPGTQYRFGVSVINEIGNTFYGVQSIIRTSTASEFSPGTLPDLTEGGPFTGTSQLWPLLMTASHFATHSTVTINFAETLTPECRWEGKFTDQRGDITLTPTRQGDRLVADITVNGTNHDSISIICEDAPNNVNQRLAIPQQDSAIQQLIRGFTDGSVGTYGYIGDISLVYLVLILVASVGFNRVHPFLGVFTAIGIISMAAYFNWVPWQSTLTGIMVAIVIMAVLLTRDRGGRG